MRDDHELGEHVPDEALDMAQQIHGGPLSPLPEEVLEAERQMYDIVKGM